MRQNGLWGTIPTILVLNLMMTKSLLNQRRTNISFICILCAQMFMFFYFLNKNTLLFERKKSDWSIFRLAGKKIYLPATLAGNFFGLIYTLGTKDMG